MSEGRKRTPIPVREVEERARGSGPVKSYFLSPEEIDHYNKTGKLLREENTMSQLTKEQYLQLRLQGVGRTDLMKKHFKGQTTLFYRQLREWGIKEKDAEERELELLQLLPKPDPMSEPKPVPIVEKEPENSIEPDDKPSSLAKQIEQLIKEHSAGSTTADIKQWAIDRNLHTADPSKQMLKLGEEYGELCQGMAKGNHAQIVDSIGDIYVVLTVLSLQLGLDIEACIDQAYVEIKDRQGRMINGVFVKQEDIA